MAKQKFDIPDIIEFGLDEYRENGIKAAILRWAQGSAMDGSDELNDKLRAMKKVESIYGAFIDHKVNDICTITPSSQIVSMRLQYEDGEVACRFLAYKQGGNWIVANLMFDVDLETQKAFVI